MKEYTLAELQEILTKHKNWMNDEEDGERANLRNSNLSYIDLRNSDLCYSDLHGSDLHSSDLRHSDLRHSDLRESNLSGSDLSGSDLDYSCWPLWCGSLDVKVDKRIFAQLAYHLCRVIVDDEECKAAQAALYPIANQFHRVEECGRLPQEEAKK